MNQSDFTHDDPALTAYALGEMEGADRAKFEQWLATNPGAQRAVAEIRSTVALLGPALADEPLSTAEKSAAPIEAVAIISAAPAAKSEAAAKPVDEYRPKGSKLLRFPGLYYMTASLAAACFAVMLFTSSEYRSENAKKTYVKLDSAVVDAMRAKAAEAREQTAKTTAEQQAKIEMLEVSLRAKQSAAKSPEVAAVADAVSLEPFEVAAPASAPTLAGQSLSFGSGDSVQTMQTGARMRKAAPAAIGGLPTATADEEANTERYAYADENPFQAVVQNPLSTFSVDVDTASYANVRRFLRNKQRPPKGAVRVEELINYFPYRYSAPTDRAPFAASIEVASAPWAPEHRLVRIGLKGREVSDAARPRANLVFLLDVSGSMNEPNKLPLLQQSMRLLVEKLRVDDRVAIVVYAGASGLALPSTAVREKAKILSAIDDLRAGGSTNGAAGIQLAYDIAKANFVSGGVNRVLLATDGDFNVGVASESELVQLIQEKAKSGVFLSVLGFGMGNYQDGVLEKLADKGNGNYAYIDSLAEARKTLVEQAGGTLVTIAKDVKLQVEFNPAQAQAYRLIGYENRMLRKEDFSNDKVDAGEIGAGHTVTALYEVVPVGVAMPEAGTVEELKYQKTAEKTRPADARAGVASAELLTLKVRYKEPASEQSTRLEFPLRDTGKAFAAASADFKFAAAVAAFGMRLKDSPYVGETKLAQVAEWAREGIEEDVGGYRTEFVEMVHEAARVAEE